MWFHKGSVGPNTVLTPSQFSNVLIISFLFSVAWPVFASLSNVGGIMYRQCVCVDLTC